MRSRNVSGLPSSCALLSTHATLFVDPGRPSECSPKRILCIGFWAVETIAICFSHSGAVSSFRKCGLPCGLRRSLCTLQVCCSDTDTRGFVSLRPARQRRLAGLAGISPPAPRFSLRGGHFSNRLSSSFTLATLGTSDWLGLTRQRLSLCKKRQALLGAPTARISGGGASAASEAVRWMRVLGRWMSYRFSSSTP